MNEETSLALWLNSLGLESTVQVDTYNDVTERIICDVLNLLLDGQQEVTSLEDGLQAMQSMFGIETSEVMEGLQQSRGSLDSNLKRLILSLLRTVHRAGVAAVDEEERGGGAPPASSERPRTPPLREVPPLQHSTYGVSTQPSGAPPIETQLAARILHLVSLGEGSFLETRVKSINRSSLSDGLVLCALVLRFEQKMGLPPRRDTVLRQINGEKMLFFAGVEINPRSRAARLKNIEASLCALREWKRFNPRYLWSGPNIADCTSNEGIDLLFDMATYTQRNATARRSSFIQSGGWAQVHDLQGHQIYVTECIPDVPLRSPPPPPPPPIPVPEEIESRPEATISSILRPLPPSPPSWVRARSKPMPVTPPHPSPNESSKLKSHDPYLPTRRILASPPPPPPPPPLEPLNSRVPDRIQETFPTRQFVSIKAKTPYPSTPPPPPPPPPPEDELGMGNEGIHGVSTASLQVVRSGREDISSSYQREKRPVTEVAIPPLLSSRVVALELNPLGNEALLSFLSRPSHIKMSSSEKFETRLWLLRLGFNVLRTNIHPLRTVPPDIAVTKEFWGYEGGPFLGDPIRNGQVLFELAGILQRTLYGVSSSMVWQENLKSFPTAKLRVQHAMNELHRLATEFGLEDSIDFGETAQLQVLSGGPAGWNVLRALSLAFVVPCDDTELDAWDLLIRMGLVKSETMTEHEAERICNGELLRQWANSVRTPLGSNKAITAAKTRRTVISCIETCLARLNVSAQDISHAVMAKRVHDGDFRLFFQIVQEVPAQNVQFLLDRQQPRKLVMDVHGENKLPPQSASKCKLLNVKVTKRSANMQGTVMSSINLCQNGSSTRAYSQPISKDHSVKKAPVRQASSPKEIPTRSISPTIIPPMPLKQQQLRKTSNATPSRSLLWSPASSWSSSVVQPGRRLLLIENPTSRNEASSE